MRQWDDDDQSTKLRAPLYVGYEIYEFAILAPLNHFFHCWANLLTYYITGCKTILKYFNLFCSQICLGLLKNLPFQTHFPSVTSLSQLAWIRCQKQLVSVVLYVWSVSIILAVPTVVCMHSLKMFVWSSA